MPTDKKSDSARPALSAGTLSRWAGFAQMSRMEREDRALEALIALGLRTEAHPDDEQPELSPEEKAALANVNPESWFEERGRG